MQSFQFAPREGSLLKVLLGVCTLPVLAVVSFAYPQHAYASLLFFLVGLMGTWREYMRWRRTQPGQHP